MTWSFPCTSLVPGLLAAKQKKPIRIWVAGCNSAQLVYTLAMGLAEVLGVEQCSAQVKIFATGQNNETLKHFRRGSYSVSEIVGLSPHLRDRYFEQIDQRYFFCTGLRRTLIFGRHDLAVDPPLSRIDLLVVGADLADFSPKIQAIILERFYFALNPGGFLYLDRVYVSPGDRFIPLDSQQNIFTTKVVLIDPDERALVTQAKAKVAVNLDQQFHRQVNSQLLAMIQAELEATKEELEITNEQLRARDQMCATLDEKLQETTYELEASNRELLTMNDELMQTNAFWEATLTSLHSQVVMILDRNLTIQIWTPTATKLWGEPVMDVQGKSFLSLQTSLPIEEIKKIVRACLTGKPGRGRDMGNKPCDEEHQLQLVCKPLVDRHKQAQGVILLLKSGPCKSSVETHWLALASRTAARKQ